MTDAAYRKGYDEQTEFLDGMTVAEAEHVLAERKATLAPNLYNRGGTDATEAYIVRKKS